MGQFFNQLQSLSWSGIVILVIILLLFLNGWLFRKIKATKDSANITHKLITFVIVLAGVLLFVLSLPIGKELKSHVLSFLGIIISAAIALSSTNILGNMMAGIMNNSMKRFRNGDLIHIGDYIGRVTRRSIFHTEIEAGCWSHDQTHNIRLFHEISTRVHAGDGES